MNIVDEFNKLTANEDDPSAIVALIGRTEDLYLECKTISTEEISSNLIANKQSVAYFNYGKCLSAFSNAEGGMVIWGLFAKETKKTEPDLIIEERPVIKATKVKTDFDSITGKVVSRRIVGVQNKVVYKNRGADEGFIVTYIPKSDEAPHRVEGERKESRRYYRRHGNGSYEMEHYELEEVFGGRAQPKLCFVIKASPSMVTGEGIKEYALAFGLMNIGRAIARFPFVEIANANLRMSDFGIDGNGRLGIPRVVGQPHAKYQGGADHVVHIHDTLWIDRFLFKPTDTVGLMDLRIACDRFTMKTFTINVNLTFMAESGRTAKYDYDADRLITVEE